MGCIYVYIRLNEPRLYMTVKKNICIFCIIRIFNTPKCRKCRKCSGVSYISVITPMHTLHSCTLAHFQNAKVAIIPGEYFRTAAKEKIKPCKSARNAWVNNGKFMVAMRKKHRKSNIGKIPFQYPEKGDSIPVVCYNYYSERCRCYDYGQ